MNQHQELDLAAAYDLAKDSVIRAGFSGEISWQASVSFDEISEADFLREHAWVALSAGMHEHVVRRRFDAISRCFCDWQSASAIVENEENCRGGALMYFNNVRKIDGIIHTARVLASLDFESYKVTIRRDPLTVLQTLPFVGPVTRYHLAKNIGLPFAKPDRHLVRLAKSVGYVDVQRFCQDISDSVHDSVPVVDIVLWRFASMTDAYLSIFRNTSLGESRGERVR